MPLPGWVEERKPVIESSPVLYWAVLFRQGAEWKLCTAVTDGQTSPHTLWAVRALTDIRYGRVEALAVAGPYWDRMAPQRTLTLATTDPDFFRDWAQSARLV